MVIEELHFVVSPEERDQFLDVEGRIWTGFLQTCAGFIRKEVWVPEDEPSRIVVMIWWNSMEEWKSITAEQCDAVDAQMGEWLRPVAFARALNVIR